MSDRDCKNCKHHTEKGCDSWDCKFEQKITRKEAIKVFKDMKKGLYPFDPTVYLDIAINSLEIDEQYELEYEQAEEIHREKEQAYMQGYEDACKKYRQEPILDKIRAKIEQKARPNELGGRGNGKSIRYGLCVALEIIDKYKAESEGKHG